MIATLTLPGSTPSLALAFSARKLANASPYWSEWIWRAEDVLQVLVLEHRGRDRRRDPEDLLLRLDLGGERHGVRAGIDAVDDLDLLLVDQPLDLVDRDVHLALASRH